MPLNKHIILGVHITDRARHVEPVQNIFTQYGCWIRTRIGLHDTDGAFCSPNGLILLEMMDDDAKVNELFDKLSKIEGVEVKKMAFDHP